MNAVPGDLEMPLRHRRRRGGLFHGVNGVAINSGKNL